MIELTTLFGLTQTLAIIVGVIIALMELRHMRQTRDTELETRQAQLFSTIFTLSNDMAAIKKWTDFNFTWEYEDYDDFMNKYGPITNPEAFSYFMLKSLQMEGIGVMLKRGLLNIEFIADWISGTIVDDWEKLEQIVREYRVRMSYPHFQEYHEYLYNEVKKYKDERLELGI